MAVDSRPSLALAGCQQRQQRLRQRLAAQALDAALLTDYREIYYFTGLLLERFPACLMVKADGGTWLVAHTDQGEAAVEQRLTYEPNKLGTTNPDLMRLMVATVARHIKGQRACRRIGWQAESMPRALSAAVNQAWDAAWFAIDDTLAALESVKDADEVAMMRWSIRADLAAYDAAQAAIYAGANELEVLAAGQRAAMLTAGEIVPPTGDYRSGVPGGFARDRQIEAGELYIIDAWTIYRGYWCDLCRAFAVGQPTDLQQSVFEHIAAVQREVPGLLKPGVKGTEVWRALDARLREHPALAGTGLVHHAGHAVGLRPHEAPDLNRDREGILEAGNVVSVEPGAYLPELRAGVRLENMYLITETGAELLSDYPMNLLPKTA